LPGSVLIKRACVTKEDPGGFQAFAFSYGYIKALIQAVTSEV
jgi:hypothetical protein